MIPADRFSMRPACFRLCLALAVVAVASNRCVGDDGNEKKLTSEEVEFFESKIRPILVEHCYECHSTSGEDIEAGLVLDSRWGWETGGDSGPAIVPGNLEESFLIDAVRHEENIVSAMPPQSKLPEEKIKLLERWVEIGAPDPREQVQPDDSVMVETFDLEKRRSEHWSWQPVANPPLPEVADREWPIQDLDRFILRKLEDANIRPASPAEKTLWLRRVYFDLIGLPPTPEQIEAFITDESDDAYEKVVDELLDSPHFGEKWARHWMDLVRYAETYGHEFDYAIPHATQYRDYLIRAFNADVPYDQLVREHIAGDLISNPRRHPDEHYNESIIGTGFWYLHEATHAPTDSLKNEADIIDNQLDVFGKAFLGLTVACTRCHDHKFDAISTADYYALSAFIQSSCRQLYPLDPGKRIETSITRIRQLQHQADLLARLSDAAPDKTPADYFDAATELITSLSDDPSSGEPSWEVFEDFESGYQKWTVTGTAFGTKPARRSIQPQKEVTGRVGKGFVSSYAGSDKHRGELVSEPFAINHDYIHLKVGGGKRKLGVELRIDGKVVHHAKGNNREDLIDHVWNVREHVGKTATIRIFDENPGGWGHVNVDQIVFTDQRTAGRKGFHLPKQESIERAAAKTGLDESRLKRWVDVLTSGSPDAAHPTPTDTLTLRLQNPAGLRKLRDRMADDRNKLESYAKRETFFESFDGSQLPDGWTTTGDAFQLVSPKTPTSLISAPSSSGTIDSGYFGNNAAGILRSPTFTITDPNIHVRLRATKDVTINVIIDNYQMAVFSGLLFNGTFLKGDQCNTDGQWQWKSFGRDLKKYVGHKAYLEFIDDGKEAIAVDEIWFAKGGPPPTTLDPLVERFSADEFSFAQAWKDALTAFAGGRRSELLDWLLSHDLLSHEELAKGLGPIADEARKIAAEMPQPTYVLAMAEGTREEADIYIRGSHINLGKKVPPRNLAALGGQEVNRLGLAEQIASRQNSLVARVFVNRLWHHLFGRGIVATVDDFGPQGRAPSHPALLDHLATEFMSNHWSTKTAIRKMVLSQTYRQSSVASPDNDSQHVADVDPTNSLLHRMRVRRLPGESIRDAILAVSGRLDKRQFGSSVPTHRTAFMTGRGARGSGPLDGAGRRTIYLAVYRNFLNPFLLTFDMPNPFGPKGRRSNSNVPAQALALMNDPFVIEQAKLWGKKIRAASDDPDARIRWAVKVAHGSEPTPGQIESYERFLNRQIKQGASEDEAWTDLAHSLLNMKSFYYLK